MNNPTINISPTTSTEEFFAGNHLYSLNIGISDGYGKGDVLDTRFINMFSYQNQMNRLYITGYLRYTDCNAVVDKYIESDSAFITATFKKLNLKREVEASTTITLLIDSVEILSNQPGEIQYQLNLVSSSYLAMNRNVRYTTYGKGKLSPTKIIQDILTDPYTGLGLTVNVDSFEKNMAPAKIDYLTTQNDNGFSALKYLLNKTIYRPKESDKTLKTLVYDENSNVIFLIDNCPDVKKENYRPIEIKVVKNSQFPGYQSPTYIGYTNNFSKLKAIVDTKETKLFDYNWETNEFGDSKINQKEIIDIVNGGYDNKCPMLSRELKEGFYRYGSEWNNDIELYTSIFRTLTQTNGLITNQDGMIGAIPGQACQVSIPNEFPILNKKTTTVKSEQSQFQTITGDWDIFEVEHFISPSEGLFRQKLILYRNRVVS